MIVMSTVETSVIILPPAAYVNTSGGIYTRPSGGSLSTAGGGL